MEEGFEGFFAKTPSEFGIGFAAGFSFDGIFDSSGSGNSDEGREALRMFDRSSEGEASTERVTSKGGARNLGGLQSLAEPGGEVLRRDGNGFAMTRQVGEEDLDIWAQALEFLGEGKPVGAGAEKAVEADEGRAAARAEGLKFQRFHFHPRCEMRREISK